MTERADLLVEIGTEEMPPKALRSLSEAFGRELREGLGAAGLSHGEMALYATPRRLAVLVSELLTRQPDRERERRGPPLAIAFDEDGQPTQAALGFARSCGVGVEQLERYTGTEGSWLVLRTTESGQSTAALVPSLVEQALARLPVPRRMRWADLDIEFVRPVHWVVLLLGEEVLESRLLGVDAGRFTRGHRFHHPRPLLLETPMTYAMVLYADGKVICEFDKRREAIRELVESNAGELGGSAVLEPDLLEEVTALVEWPAAVVGSFEEEFLELPPQVLVATMKNHLRCFHVVDAQDNLLPNFIAISNIESRAPRTVRAGYERVIRPRLKDAAFFFAGDLRAPLEDRLDRLKEVVFQERLGTLFDKSQRVSKLAMHVAIAMGESPESVKYARRAGLLCKCDLLTEMVEEFPELQGYMGGQYALRGGEPEPVATAIEEHYLPRYAGDRIPASVIGRALAIADRLDTLLGTFGIGEVPTGDKDPFALRRAALGSLRIVIEGEVALDLPKLLHAAAEQYGALFEQETVAAQVEDFMLERLRTYFVEQGIPVDVFAAVAARGPRRPYDFARRMRAVETFRRLPEAAGLAAANKRIQNILRQVDEGIAETFRDDLFAEDAEWNLAAKLVGLGPRVRDLIQRGEYETALRSLASLRESVDAFFDTVKVMDDDAQVRRNRLALLGDIRGLFLEIADVSLLQGTETP